MVINIMQFLTLFMNDVINSHKVAVDDNFVIIFLFEVFF